MPSTLPRIGLALGGGGARGLAHIALLEVLDELGIKPTIIVGCSIGAILGTAYACGMTAREIRERGEVLLANRMQALKYVFTTRKSKISELLSLKSFSNLHLNGEKLVDLVLPDHLPLLIEQATIPLRIVATDYERGEERVFAVGPILQAVGASIAIPGVISAPRIDGRLHVDGGVTNPVPFNHARGLSDIVIAVDVTGKPKISLKAHPSNMELALGSVLVTGSRLAEAMRAINPPEVYIKPPVENFTAGDFFKLGEILQAAEPAKDELKRALDVAMTKFAKNPAV